MDMSETMANIENAEAADFDITVSADAFIDTFCEIFKTQEYQVIVNKKSDEEHMTTLSNARTIPTAFMIMEACAEKMAEMVALPIFQPAMAEDLIRELTELIEKSALEEYKILRCDREDEKNDERRDT